MRPLSTATLILVAGCVGARVEPVVVQVTAPVATTSAPAPTDPPPPAPPPPAPKPLDPATDADKLAIARGVCHPAIKHAGKEVRVGCQSCPPFPLDESAIGGETAVDPESFWAIESVVGGSFTAPGADEAAVVFEGCEPHSGNYGGTLLVKRTRGTYRSLGYYSGVHPSGCKPYPRGDGRDLLVCEFHDMHQGYADHTVFSFDFKRATAQDPFAGFTTLVDVGDGTAALCSSGVGDAVSKGAVLGYQVKDAGRGTPPELVVTIVHKKLLRTPALARRIDLACKQAASNSADVDMEKLLGLGVRDDLVFQIDGVGWKPTPKTKRVLQQL